LNARFEFVLNAREAGKEQQQLGGEESREVWSHMEKRAKGTGDQGEYTWCQWCEQAQYCARSNTLKLLAPVLVLQIFRFDLRTLKPCLKLATKGRPWEQAAEATLVVFSLFFSCRN
jgi:uncharacterized UBP type Zn finger protein